MNAISKLFLDISESFIEKLYGEYNGFSKFKGYIVCASDVSIFALSNAPTTKKHFVFLQTILFKDF